MESMIALPIFFSVLISLCVIGYATWILFLFPKLIFPLFKLNSKKSLLWQKYLIFILPVFGWLMCWLASPFIMAFMRDRATNTLDQPPVGLFALVLFAAASVFLGLTSLPYAFFRMVLKVFKRTKQFVKVDLALAMLTALVFAFGGAFCLGFILDNYANAQASNFFILNAAIKNTCFMDPKRIGCPRNLTELSDIEPGEFARLSKTTQFTYEYYPATNQYTFIARYSKNKAVIFDWRLVETDKIDFRTVNIDTWGQDHIKNPPNFPGPWDNLPEWNK